MTEVLPEMEWSKNAVAMKVTSVAEILRIETVRRVRAIEMRALEIRVLYFSSV